MPISTCLVSEGYESNAETGEFSGIENDPARRCSADPAGNPWNPAVPLFRWDGEKWVRHDVPDFNATVPPEVSANNAHLARPPEKAAFSFAVQI